MIVRLDQFAPLSQSDSVSIVSRKKTTSEETTNDELMELMDDLRAADVDIFTMGQYLQPTKKHLPVVKYYTPEEFKQLYDHAMERGFRYVESGPLVRSSYHAGRGAEVMEQLLNSK